mgnify:CR=1 FL=1
MMDSLFSRSRGFATAVAGISLLAATAVPAQGPATASQAASAADASIALSPADEQGRYRYMINFDEPALLDLGGSVKSGSRLNTRAPEFERAMSEIQQFQAARIDSINAAVARSVEVSHHFVVTRNGIAARLTPQEAKQVAQLPAVESVERERVYSLDLFRSGEFIGATSVWDGTSTPDGSALRGEGMIAGVLDSGINLDHPSFANDPSCGHGEGGTPDKLISAVDCSTSDGSGRCDGPDANDTNGHGSHTASTVVGNLLDNSASPSPGIPAPFTEMSGVAPCAHIRAYKVCPGDTCPGADLQAGFATLLLDGDVDAMNYSISGGTNPWNDFDRIKLDIVEAGTFVAASAGNTSDNQPDPVGQVNHRGPWVMSVAASTQDVVTGKPVSLEGGPQGVPGIEGTGPAMTQVFIGPLRYSGDVDAANFEGCNPWPADSFSGEAALISRGACTFEDKVNNAVAAGATFVIVFNNVGGGAIVMGGLETTTVSSVMLSNSDGLAMVSTLAGATAEVTVLEQDQALVDPTTGDILAGFSFRGPTPGPLQNLQKPNITAPGVNIFAARADGQEFGFLSGTSMSGPHIAGAGVLVRQAHPTWSPIEVKSALQMTAKKTGLKDDAEIPWDWDDVGSGRVEMTRALLAGLVMDETIQNFLEANPSTGGDVRTLNLPSVRDVECDSGCTWTRTVRAGQDFPTSWTVITQNPGLGVQVTPTSFELAEREILFRDGAETGDTLPNTSEQVVDITVNNVAPGEIRFGEIRFTEDGDLTPEAHITIAVQRADVR